LERRAWSARQPDGKSHSGPHKCGSDAYQLASPPVGLQRGRYVAQVTMAVSVGGATLLAIDGATGKALGIVNMGEGLPGRSALTFDLPIAVPDNTVRLVLANDNPAGKSTWSVSSARLSKAPSGSG